MRKKALSTAAAALTALAAVAVAAPAPASAAAVTIEVERSYAGTVREWIDPFTCPTNMVLTGRSHYGDERAPTTYYCSFILINGEQAQVRIGEWTSRQKESRADYSALDHQVVVGRWHEGDENGYTRYRPATVYWRGQQVLLADGDISGAYRESSHTWHADQVKVLTGRKHSGDENGTTYYRFATVTVAG
ncbi:hypothetical protein Ppa06_51930 [Planomonospora parontospora subsp. parontospora]|uniref:Uncharacterized protein n=2 Tax=Planomonospora parontospora TaxID=58119 RepID=A0AA37F786_9ACTN|nr:hypothetical protein [Planomonospora parontospora]GGK87588.1 hypothetical protein GCM10010126_53750 [Planomonospora parontospora]GII11395.1 hypothetical protein Ppa06_51930 [Planomonospora parontospora subsp. parontospora]